jgi:hypothetical protein
MRYSFDEATFIGMKIKVDNDVDPLVGLFTDSRIYEDSIPEELCAFEIRHNDENEPDTLEKHVLVNFYGTFITHKTYGENWFERNATLDFVGTEYIPLCEKHTTISYMMLNEKDKKKAIDTIKLFNKTEDDITC